MDAKKRKALEADGWRFGSAQDLLQLSDEEAVVIEVKVALAIAVRRLREKTKMSQVALAKKIGSSQSRIAKLEHGDGSVELFIKALAAMGATKQEIGRELGRAA